LPQQHRLPRQSDPADPPPPPKHKGAHALVQLLASSKGVRKLVEEYSGGLPNGKVKCRSFDRHFKAFLALARKNHGDEGYPFNVPDEGRRALIAYHRRKRQARRDAGAAETEAVPTRIKRLSELFKLAPLDRLEFDAHKIDVDWQFQIPRPDGHQVLRNVRRVTLLVLICAVSRYLIAYVLVLGEYNHLDVLRLFRRALQPWAPRQLIVPGMAYPDQACLGLPVDAQGCGPRGLLIAGDNARMHHANLVSANVLANYRGVMNLGAAHVPEGRPIVEAFNRRFEQGVLRLLAGSFHPQTRTCEKTLASYLRSEDHPLHWEGLLDLMDVVAAGYNVTPHSGLNNRTPASVLDTHLASGWSWWSTEAARDASRLTTMRFTAHVRGARGSGRYPYVQFHEARYRSQRLMGQRDYVGRSFIAEADVEDLRHIVLLDPKDGTPWSRLTALPPWNRSVHDLHLRQQINRACKRGLLQIAGGEDAVAAYHEFTRAEALSQSALSDAGVRLEVQATRLLPSHVPSLPRQSIPPRAGRVSFVNRKD
jgi:hypothetical protein